jgi:hypothetical protein
MTEVICFLSFSYVFNDRDSPAVPSADMLAQVADQCRIIELLIDNCKVCNQCQLFCNVAS